ncbi:hypothetical protein JH06_1539 [Blastocystis sp. subtype 4]|uniref:hypothetical protein n=1 Tax=Blastocystis sp. subtype 4 TaxID=944170 RepID=UPI0007121130|nr:hypothetical protein JH06_1539 [Blastocystis sp. subtype 4]KNB44981.1 hypothetical protein JH06_1539 [Blastocystis sp. subtype 4]|eukprot:XP_014528424.1 hypothetical protein JH06_1539 [Blastocystis sp. subtype 4]
MLSRSVYRLFSTSATKKVAVILSGCGVYDGSEIQESVFILESLSRRNAKYQCFAPNIDQMHVINHLTGDPMDEKRNVLIESARIARSDVKDLIELKQENFDVFTGFFPHPQALVLPGGFGVAKNLSDFGAKGPKMEVLKSVGDILVSFHNANKPIGACCIAPVLLARMFPGVRLTLGKEEVGPESPFADACGAAKTMGSTHVPCKPKEVCIDETKIVTTPAYMYTSPIHIVRDGVDSMIEQVLKMA